MSAPTMDERRAVARRLREHKCPVLPSQQTTREAVDAVVGCMGLEDDDKMCTVRNFLDRLADLIDPGEGMDEDGRAALDWVREHGGLDEVRRQRRDSVPRASYERNLAKRQRQVDESHAALRRRNGWIAELEHLLCKEMSYSLRRDAGCLAPEALDADGAEIRVGDTVWYVETGEQCKVVEVDSRSVSVDFRVDIDGAKHTGSILPANLTHRAPVIAADGVPLEVGQTVWHVSTGAEYTVRDVTGGGAHLSNGDRPGGYCRAKYLTHQRPVLDADGVPCKEGDTVYALCDGSEHVVECVNKDRTLKSAKLNSAFYLVASRCTHTKPDLDTWERIEADCAKFCIEYCDERGLLDDACNTAVGDASTRHCTDCGDSCEERMARDLVRRARALAERGR